MKLENEGGGPLCTCDQQTPGGKLEDTPDKYVIKSESVEAFRPGLAHCVKRENPRATATGGESSFSKSNNCTSEATRSQPALHNARLSLSQSLCLSDRADHTPSRNYDDVSMSTQPQKLIQPPAEIFLRVPPNPPKGNRDLTEDLTTDFSPKFQNNSERNAYCPTRRPVPPDFLDLPPKNYKCAKHSAAETEEEGNKEATDSELDFQEISGGRYLFPAVAQSRRPILDLSDEAEGMESQRTLWVRLNNLIGGYSSFGDSEVPELTDSTCTLTAARYRGSVAGRVVSAESAARLAEHSRLSSPRWHQEGNASAENKQSTTLHSDARDAVTGRHSTESKAEKDGSPCPAEDPNPDSGVDSQALESPSLLRPIYSSQETEDGFTHRESKHWDPTRRHSRTAVGGDSRRNEVRGQTSPLPQLSSTGVENSEEKPNPDRMETLLHPLVSRQGRNGSVWPPRKRREASERAPLLVDPPNDLENMNRTFGGRPLRVDGGQRKGNNAYSGSENGDKVGTNSKQKPSLLKPTNNNKRNNLESRHSATSLNNVHKNSSDGSKTVNYRKRQSLVAALSHSHLDFPSKRENSRHSTCCSPDDLKLFAEEEETSPETSPGNFFERNSLKSRSLYVSQPSLHKTNSISLNFGVTNPELLRFGNGNCLDKIAHLRKTRKKPLQKVYQFFSAPPGQPGHQSSEHNNLLPPKSAPPWSARFTDIWRIFGGAGSTNKDQKLLKRSLTLGSLVQPSREESINSEMNKEETETIRAQEDTESSRTLGQFTRVKSLPATPVRKKLSAQAEESHVVVERIYCVRQVLHKVSEEYYSYNNGSESSSNVTSSGEHSRYQKNSSVRVRPSAYHSTADLGFADSPTPVLLRQSASTTSEENPESPLELPQRLMRRRSQRSKASMRRSRSQPMHSPVSDEDNEHRSGFTISIPSRTGDSGIISATSGEDTGDQASDESGRSPRDNSCAPSLSFRSSTYSTASSVTTSSLGSNDNNSHERGSWDSDTVILAEGLWDHVTMQPEELQFNVGDVIQVCDWSFPDFWFGTSKDKSGWFPASHVRLLANQNVEDVNLPSSETAEIESDENSCHRMKLLRRSVLQELISTERDYFSLLRNLVEGFLYQARRRAEMFSAERLLLIFGNLEQIYELHRQFLSDLEKSVDMKDPDNSTVGHCFLQHENAFEIYSEYCNNHALSCSELASLYRQASYRQFFEACRLLRGMPELSLDAFLLTPVQRICKYPLQLAELVKSTRPAHPDFSACREALIAMRKVARIINDRKRRLEHLQKIAAWQRSVENWQGSELIEESSMLIHSGELTCRCVRRGSQLWTKELMAFLFDQTLVLCKKDILKRNQLIFKDRVYLKDTKWEPVADGKDPFFGISVKNGWKLVSDDEEFCFLFMSRNRQTKMAWTLAIRDQESVMNSTSIAPPTEQEKRIALAGLRAPNPNNSTKVQRKVTTPVIPPVTENSSAIHESKSVPGKMWNKLNNSKTPK